MNIKRLILALALVFPTTAQAVTLVTTSDPGFYNDSIGTALNNTNGGNTSTGYFPQGTPADDSSVTFATAPDLTAAAPALGNWLSDPGNLNANWTAEASIPNAWTPDTEVAVIYRFDTLGATNVQASFGVDNGIFAWLDGVYLFGARGPGGPVPGEYNINLGDLAAGTHYLQLLLEDHGATNGYDVVITADTFIAAPVPEPAPLALLGLAALAFAQRNRGIK